MSTMTTSETTSNGDGPLTEADILSLIHPTNDGLYLRRGGWMTDRVWDAFQALCAAYYAHRFAPAAGGGATRNPLTMRQWVEAGLADGLDVEMVAALDEWAAIR